MKHSELVPSSYANGRPEFISLNMDQRIYYDVTQELRLLTAAELYYSMVPSNSAWYPSYGYIDEGSLLIDRHRKQRYRFDENST